MKLTVKNKKSIIFTNLLKPNTIIATFGIFALTLILVIFLSIAGIVPDFVAIFILFILPILYVLFIVIDSSQYASNSYIEFKENSINIYYKNLTSQGHVSVPLSQLESANLNQPFLLKLFGICVVMFRQESGLVTTAFGYDYTQATKLITEVVRKHKVRTTS